MQWHIPIPVPFIFAWNWFARPALLYLLLPYVMVSMIFVAFQRSLIYQPWRKDEISSRDAGFQEFQVAPVSLHTSDGLLLNGWHIPGLGRQYRTREDCDARLAEGEPVVLIFQGNGGNREVRGVTFRTLASLNADVFVFDYRGYGENPGSPSESAIFEDARIIWKYLTIARGIDPARIVIYGESLGGGVATQLAADVSRAGTPPGGLCLCATFSSLVDAGKHNYPWLPVRLLLIDRFNSIKQIPDVTSPILMIHGRLDTIVPYVLGERLFAAAPEQSRQGIPKKLVPLSEANHNDILTISRDRYQGAMREFLSVIRDSFGDVESSNEESADIPK